MYTLSSRFDPIAHGHKMRVGITSDNLQYKNNQQYLGQQGNSETHNFGREQFGASTWTRQTKQLHCPERPD